jgi:hypothetical protein
MNQGMRGWSSPAADPVVSQRRTSLPTHGVTLTGDSTWRQFSTPWTITVTNVKAGQRVLIRASAAMSNSTNYCGIAIHRVTGGLTMLGASVRANAGHAEIVTLEVDDLAPGVGTIQYEVYGGSNAGTLTLRNDTPSAFSLDKGNSLLTAEVYTPPTS